MLAEIETILFEINNPFFDGGLNFLIEVLNLLWVPYCRKCAASSSCKDSDSRIRSTNCTKFPSSDNFSVLRNDPVEI